MLRTSFSDPFRNSHLNALATDRLVEISGWKYHEVVATTLNDAGAALDLRVPGIDLYQNSALKAVFSYVYGEDDTITAADAAEDIIKAWKGIPVATFPDSNPEATLDKMRDIYRGQLGLLPIVKTNVQQIDQTSSSAAILVPSILIPLAILSAICAYLFVERRKKHGDSIWAVKREELTFDDPPVVVGRGTFGLVLLAEYRGTEVAVKRVIPPRMNLSLKGGGKDSGVGSLITRTSLLGAGDRNEMAERRRSNFDYKCCDDAETVKASVSIKISATFINSGTSSDSNHRPHVSFLKKFRKQNDYENMKSEFVVEMRQLSKLRHPCITTVMGAVIDPSEEPMLVMEYMEKGSLYDVLHNETVPLDGGLLLPNLRDIAQGARFLHAADPQVIHGDIKAQNLLVDSKFRAKVTDFGLSQKKEMGVTAGTPLWIAPELLRGESSNTAASDVYSFGIVLYEVYSRQDPYAGEKTAVVLSDVYNRNINKRPPIPPAMLPKVSELMIYCVKVNPIERPTFETIDLLLKKLYVQNVEPSLNTNLKGMTDLICNVFPPHIADALKHGRKVEQENHECVTIFFFDIVGFTTISQSITAQKVCQMLDRLYQKFDDLWIQHDIFKIETIGDAYMAITNLVKDQTLDHVKCAARFSKDAIRAASETYIDEENPDKGFVQIRVGFHSGPVIADVIVSRLPKYGVFGDTVNTASRMESNSEIGRIHCSKASADLLREQDPEMKLVNRGNIRIKGKGEMCTFWVGDDDEEANS